MNEFIDKPSDLEQPKLPMFLKVLCILSYIALGFAALGVLIMLISGPPSVEKIEQGNLVMMKSVAQLEDQHMTGLADLMRKLAAFSEYQQINFWPSFGLNLITTFTGFVAVFYMWRLRKRGFYFYIVYNLLAVFGVYIFVPANMIPGISIIMGFIFSAIFVILYGVNVKHLK